MASRIRKRSSLSTASFDRCTLFPYTVIPIPARMTMSAMTIIISIRVNPDIRDGRAGVACSSSIYQLPVPVLRAVERLPFALAVHVEDVLPAPARRIGLVLVGAHPPLRLPRHRIDGDAAQELELASRGVAGSRHAVHELLERFRIALA